MSKWINLGDINYMSYGGCLVRSEADQGESYANSYNVFNVVTDVGDEKERIYAALYSVDLDDITDKELDDIIEDNGKNDIIYDKNGRRKSREELIKELSPEVVAKEYIELMAPGNGISFKTPYPEGDDFLLTYDELEYWMINLGMGEYVVTDGPCLYLWGLTYKDHCDISECDRPLVIKLEGDMFTADDTYYSTVDTRQFVIGAGKKPFAKSDIVVEATEILLFKGTEKDDITRLEKESKEMKEKLDRATVLLKAAKDLLSLQEKSSYVLNLLEKTVHYDDADCDGGCLMEDIEALFDELDINIEEN